MFKSSSATAAVFAAAALCPSAVWAQSPSPPSKSAGTRLSQAECRTLWNQANPSGGPTITMAQAQRYVSDFKSVDRDDDGSISKVEFNAGCKNGNVKGASASTGMSPGTSGSSKPSPRIKSNKY